jgi:hypothetical protein
MKNMGFEWNDFGFLIDVRADNSFVYITNDKISH